MWIVANHKYGERQSLHGAQGTGLAATVIRTTSPCQRLLADTTYVVRAAARHEDIPRN
jgi:hypothetical protein